MKHTHLTRLIFAALLLCFLLSGCAFSENSSVSTEPETEEQTTEVPDPWAYHEINPALEKLNYDLDYTTVYYDYPGELSGDRAGEEFRNLSGTQVLDDEQTELAVGWRILSDETELRAFEQTAADVEESAVEPAYRLISMTRRTASVEYNEEFFRENNLLLVDLCAESHAVARFYPENLAVSGDTASLDLRWDSDSSCVGSSAGQYCLIPVPKDCTAAELNLIYDPA